nr:MAG TPA: hypothetical protein [Caudoviricetes sp.]
MHQLIYFYSFIWCFLHKFCSFLQILGNKKAFKGLA